MSILWIFMGAGFFVGSALSNDLRYVVAGFAAYALSALYRIAEAIEDKK